MEFVYEFELCSIIFLLIVMFFYFTKKRFDSITDRVFSLFLFATMLTMIFDVTASRLLQNAKDYPIWLHYALNIGFYASQIFVPFFGYIYSLAIVNKFDGRLRGRKKAFWIPIIIQEFLAFSSPIFGLYFTIDKDGSFSYGTLHIFHYILPILFLVLALFMGFKYRRAITGTQFLAIAALSAGCVVFAVLQALFPKYLIVNMTGVLSAFLMYLSLQNPDAAIDTLTGLFNSTAFLSYINKAFIEKQDFTLFSVKLNDLKLLNSSFGVENCDRIIELMADYLKNIDGTEMIFRITGGSFGAIVYGRSAAARIRKELIERFNESWKLLDIEIMLNIKVIQIDVPKYATTPEELLHNLNYCSYMMDGSAESYIYMDESIARKIEEEARVEQVVRDAIAKEQFKIVYQPIYSVKENRYVALEALARVYDDKLGDILPEVFLPIAERDGCLIKMGIIVLNKVCDLLSRINIEQLGLKYININLSNAECMQDDLASNFYSVVEGYEIDPRYIHFDINETTATNAMEQLRYSMFRMLQSGCDFALDDFGTGYSNLSGIMELPFSMVKLDRTIVTYYENPEKTLAVMESVIDMLEDLGMEICAEGIENKEQDEMMRKIGAGYMQGFLYSKPLDEQGIISFLCDSEGGVRA